MKLNVKFTGSPTPASTLSEYQVAVPDSVAPAAKSEADGGGHYYSVESDPFAPTGDRWTPLYAPEKSFTLREARALNADGKFAIPSVTTYFGALAKPQLERWKMRNVAEAMADIIEKPLLRTREELIAQALAIASNASKGAMDLGTRIHTAIEAAVGGKEFDADMLPYVDAVMAERSAQGITSSHPEECMGSLKYGYAGRCDDYTDDMKIIDYKSRKSKGKKVPTYETDALQLAAYGYARFGNRFFKEGSGHIYAISTTTPGLVTVHDFSGRDLIPAFEVFLALTATWRFMNRFDPRFVPVCSGLSYGSGSGTASSMDSVIVGSIGYATSTGTSAITTGSTLAATSARAV